MLFKYWKLEFHAKEISRNLYEHRSELILEIQAFVAKSHVVKAHASF